MTEQSILSVRNVSKYFGHVIANDNISFDVRKGEIHCLLGENGAGKSTLTECIYGFYTPDSGVIEYKGDRIEVTSPSESIRLGIGMVHQHFALVESLSVIENIIVGTPDAPTILNLQAAKDKLSGICKQYNVNLDLNAKVWDLSVGQQQWVEILKMLYLDAELLILDEPTAVLTPDESKNFFKIIKRMTSNGISIILISHKLTEVMQSDRVTILRKGKLIGTLQTKETSRDELTHKMVGGELNSNLDKEIFNSQHVVLAIENICLKHYWGGDALKDICLSICKNEIIGIAGVAGNGQKELFETLVGVVKPDSGTVKLDGEDITGAHPQKIMELGIGHIPQDRYAEGLVSEFSISDNLILGAQRRDEFTRGIFLDEEEIGKFGKKCISDFDIVAPSTRTLAKNLSGGNAQKIILAREFWQSSKVLLANQPTRGLDVGVIENVYRLLLEKRREGYAILLASEELDDLFKLADKIAVMYKGEIVKVMDIADVKIDEIGLLMAGHKIDEIHQEAS